MLRSLVGSEMCIRDRYQRRVRGVLTLTMALRSLMRMLWLMVAARALLAHEYSGCFPGQVAGPGFISFDHCNGAPTPPSFVCKVTANCSLDQCGGPEHLACGCAPCTLDDVTARASSNFSCGCDPAPNFGCWCDPELYACRDNRCVPARVGGSQQECEAVCV
eukprot:TRINITY_DN12294_c0_g1_i1.p1 TRINITY_DN12294_c0_g1~~TRINITY_DN12294_c0_g1_i1.p1  ORF type:complete len:162 (-),score=28.02 TRINITY_DN12294_c0_g1_i1:252-737(-)